MKKEFVIGYAIVSPGRPSSFIYVVVAAGNGPRPSCEGVSDFGGPSSPACVKNSIAVGAVNLEDEIFYQRGNLPEIMAPGINIKSTFLGGG